MKPKPVLYAILVIIAAAFTACQDIIEPSLSKQVVTPEAPANLYVSTSYTINFWWDGVDHALSYHLQVVTPDFNAPGSLVLDTVVKQNKFSYNLNPGTYQWRLTAENGSSQTAYSAVRTFTIAASSIKQQTVQLTSPANNYVTNKSAVLFQWGNLYGATQYRLEIDTNNFENEAAIVANLVLPGQQGNFTLPKSQIYQWRVRAENDTAQAQWSAINLITLDQVPPGQVAVTAPADNATSPLPVSLQWSATATAARYKLYVFKSDSITLYNTTYPAILTTTIYSFSSGNSGDRVYWKVSAIDAAGNEGQASQLRSFVLQ